MFDDRIWVLGGGDSKYGYGAHFFADVWYSRDAKIWQEATYAAPWGKRFGQAAVVFDGKMWVLGGARNLNEDILLNDVWSSPDGVNWTQVTAAAPWAPRCWHTVAAFDGKIWLLGGAPGEAYAPAYCDVWSSPDGVHWTQVTAAAQWSPRSRHATLVYDGKLWVLGGVECTRPALENYVNNVWASADGANWAQATPAAQWSPRSGPGCLVFQNKMWVIGGGPQDAWTSANGADWDRVTDSGPWRCSDQAAVAFHDDMYLLGGHDGRQFVYRNEVWYSSDGTEWKTDVVAVPWDQATETSAAAYNGSLCVSGGHIPTLDYGGASQFSVDGRTWNCCFPMSPGERWNFALADYAGSLWLTGGEYYGPDTSVEYNDVWRLSTSSYVEVLHHAPWANRRNHSMLAHDGKLWVIGGMMGDHGTLQDVWSTTDGASWTQVTNSAPVAAVPAAFEFAGRVWARGSDDHLWNTTDGANWTQAPTGAPMGNQVACNGKIWVFETQDPRRMWWSQDGITWTQLPGQSPFGPRSGSAITVFDNKIWVICGDYFPDVWYFIEQEPAFGFTAQPRGGWAEEGAPWLLTAGTTGTLGPVTYQWLRDSYYMPGATDAAYNIPSLTPDDAGWYTCVVTDNNGLHVPDPVHIDVFPAGSLPADRGEGLFTVIASILLAFRVLARRHWG